MDLSEEESISTPEVDTRVRKRRKNPFRSLLRRNKREEQHLVDSQELQTRNPTLDRQISASSAADIPRDNRYLLSAGKIHFWDNYCFAEGKPYIRVSHDIDISHVVSIVRQKWRISSPRIVLTIVSNCKPLREWNNLRQIRQFKRGLVKAMNSTSMWILTNGVNVGVSRIIGDAISQELKERKLRRNVEKKAELYLVGVTREDHLRYGHLLESERVELRNEGGAEETGARQELNIDHSHFLIVRDSTQSKTGINLFILRLIQYLSVINSEEGVTDNTDTCSLTGAEIPVISLLVGGGYDCARLTLDQLKRKSPVVVLRGTGGLADLLAFAFLEVQQRCRDVESAWNADFIESVLKPELTLKIVNRFPRMRDNSLSRNIFRDRIVECVRLSKQEERVFLSVLNIHNSATNLENLSEYLLRALFSSQHVTREREESADMDLLLKDLALTLDWNCPHVAANEVVSRDPSVCLRLEKTLFMSSLTRPEREEFVDLFLSNGFRLHKFLTPKRMRTLYKRALEESAYFRVTCWEGVLGHSPLDRVDKDFVDVDLNWLIEVTTDLRDFSSAQTLALNVMGLYPTDTLSAERKALTLLMIYSLLVNRHKLAKVLWKHSDQPVHLALVAATLCTRLQWHVQQHDLKTELKDPARLFSDYAIGVLDLCFNEDESRANALLSEESFDWNLKTAVDLAACGQLRAFLAHPCCQKWLTNTFYGNIRLRELSWGFLSLPDSFKVLSSALLVFPMYFWVRFHSESDPKIRPQEDNDDERDNQDEDQLLAPPPHSGDQSLQTTGRQHKRRYTTIIRQREILIRKQPPLHKMVFEMWNAPITKFWTFQLFYIIYLALFSVAVLWPACGHFYLDVCVSVWTGLILIEYIRRTLTLYRKYTSVPMLFKCVEIILIIAFIVLYVSGRVFGRQLFSAYTMKVMLSFGLLYFYYRLFAVHLPISPTLGPLLFRLRIMVTEDFINFMRMALLVIASSAVVIQAITFPDADGPVMAVLSRAFYRAFFALFITPMDDLKGL